MKNHPRVWILIALSLIVSLSACILVPVTMASITAATITGIVASTSHAVTRSCAMPGFGKSDARMDWRGSCRETLNLRYTFG
jgi:hypothetical protein